MSSTVDTATLHSLTGQLFETLVQFKTLLNDETNILKGFDMTALPLLLENKSKLSDQIERQFKQLAQALGNASTPLNEWVSNEIFATFPKNLQKNFHNLIELIQECHDLNIANGIMVQTLSNFNQASLNILTGQTDAESQVYGASGVRQKSKNQASLGQA